ncbi:ribonuclease H-like domain-containing protein [Mucidula mucida]|nr:ribonuclease H-like domain-containing protein [Mucidula mucida]
MSPNILEYGLVSISNTDNISDKAMLEGIFKSLLESVTAVEKHSDLPVFSIDAEVTTSVLDSVPAIDNTIHAIMDDVPDDGGYIVVGFDSEWNVETGPGGRVTGRGSTAVVQIAYDNHIYILLIGEMLAAGRLPQQLLSFLRNDQILKAGHLVNRDLKQLETAANQPRNSFTGGIDLASFAKARFLITNARISLADLTAQLLHQCLPKNRAERISSNWTDRDLTTAQIQYAACDAQVALQLFNKINKTPVPVPLSPTTPAGSLVVILNDTNSKIVAHGSIRALTSSEHVDEINLTPTRIC